MSHNPARAYLPFPHHAFLARVTDDITPFLQAGLAVARAVQGRVAPEEIGKLGRPQPFDYTWYVWTKLTAMLESLHRMYIAAAMVRHSPPARSRLGRLVTFRDWREYQSYVFYGSAVGILDTALILTSAVYELGVPERRCERDVVVGNSWLAHSAARRTLIQLEKRVAGFRKKRNPLFHRGEAPNVSAGFSKEAEVLILATESGTGLKGYESLAATTRAAIGKTLADEWTGLADALSPATIALCDALLPVYEQHMQRKPSLEDGIVEFRRRLGLGLGDPHRP